MDLLGLWVLLAAACGLQATPRSSPSGVRCQCHGRSRYCLWDAEGLRCVDCQGNTEGRHCERCKAGFYQQGAGQSCVPCSCDPTGSVSNTCDSRGRCSCQDGAQGDKCNVQRRRSREDSGSPTPPCFCYAHSSSCSAPSGYSAHDISSTFSHGTDGWTVASSHGVTPSDVHFRWSPSHGDLEVISKNSLPVYLYAPERFLGNHLFSYGQNLSFSLRLDRGVRHPSTNDVILEGGGLRVSASLGDLRSIVPCGQKIRYSFRLDELPGSRWRPQLSWLQFQTLLQNLTAVKIRATFGENGRGYLDNVHLTSARRGDGAPAAWVRTCVCPEGYEGEFCQRCSAGFRRRVPAEGAFSACEPCNCGGGSCDPLSGDCYSADETPQDHSCEPGFYRDFWKICTKCPCPQGVSCSLPAGSLRPQCHHCPIGTTGVDCNVCHEGYYGTPCRPCQCNGHIDVSVARSCDQQSGECLKCMNNTRGRHCETCLNGFYHNRVTDACKPCNCDFHGSESRQCDDLGLCRCRPGFEGERCQRLSCPSCFSPVQTMVDGLLERLQQLETQAVQLDGGRTSDTMEAAVKAAQQLLDKLEEESKELRETEQSLQRRLSTISRAQLLEEQNLQNMDGDVGVVRQKQEELKAQEAEVRTLLMEMRRKLDEARSKLNLVEFPLGDTVPVSGVFSSLLKSAKHLADRHQGAADTVEETSDSALKDSEQSLVLVRALMNREQKVQKQILDLETLLDQVSGGLGSLHNQAVNVSRQAKEEIQESEELLRRIAEVEPPSSLREQTAAMVSTQVGLKEDLDQRVSDFESLQDRVQPGLAAGLDLLDLGRAAQQDAKELLERVGVAEVQTEEALRRINSSTEELEEKLKQLRGFDKHMNHSRALADAAVARLPKINATIQKAVSDNADTLAALGHVGSDYSAALGLMGVLQDLVTSLEGMLGTFPPSGDLVNNVTKLNTTAKELEAEAADLSHTLEQELHRAQKTEHDAEQVALDAAAAAENAKQATDAVGRTLRDINALLDNLDKPGATVDEERLRQLEEALANAQQEVASTLHPRLQDMEQQENATRRRLLAVNVDIDNILRDIANLEDILNTVPSGCFNSPPIEEA